MKWAWKWPACFLGLFALLAMFVDAGILNWKIGPDFPEVASFLQQTGGRGIVASTFQWLTLSADHWIGAALGIWFIGLAVENFLASKRKTVAGEIRHEYERARRNR